ncbi:MAG: hypothetical protein R2800_00455 [Flavipsychrobacter sp.]
MESTEFNQQEEPKLEITEFIKLDLREAAKWGKFLSVVGFIGLGFMILAGFVMALVLSAAMDGLGASPFPSSGIGVMYIIFAGIYFYPIYALLKFSTKMKTAVNFNDGVALTESFRYLKGMLRYMGIITIVVLCIYGAFALFGAAIGIGAAMG